MYERITASDPVGSARYGHDFRYRLAVGFIDRERDFVLDAACGSGYGFHLLGVDKTRYLGFDTHEPEDIPFERWARLDLNEAAKSGAWNWAQVFIGFETIEHLTDCTQYVEMAKQVEKWIIMSVPVVPTVGVNPWHVRDFAPGQLRSILEDDAWEHYQTVGQPSESSEIVVMRRRRRA